MAKWIINPFLGSYSLILEKNTEKSNSHPHFVCENKGYSFRTWHDIATHSIKIFTPLGWDSIPLVYNWFMIRFILHYWKTYRRYYHFRRYYRFVPRFLLNFSSVLLDLVHQMGRNVLLCFSLHAHYCALDHLPHLCLVFKHRISKALLILVGCYLAHRGQNI